MFEFLGHKVGMLSSDVYLIDVGGIRWISLGGFNILIPGLEKIRQIAGFDYKVIKELKPDALSEEEEEKVPGDDYFIPHIRKLDITLFGEKQDIDFSQTTEGHVQMFATVRIIDPERVSYSGTDVLIVQVPRLIEDAARDVFWETDINTVIGISKMDKAELKASPVIRDIARKIMATIDKDKLREFGFEVFNVVIVDIELSEATKKSRTQLQERRVELLAKDTQQENEQKKVEIERLKAQQEEQKGKAVNQRLAAAFAGPNGEWSTESLRDAARWEIENKKYQNGIANLTIIEAGGKDTSDTATAGAVLGTTLQSHLSTSGKKKLLDKMDTEINKEVSTEA
jgi:hypothetical protein